MNNNPCKNSSVAQPSECYYPGKQFKGFLSSSFLANKTKAHTAYWLLYLSLIQSLFPPYLPHPHTPTIVWNGREFAAVLYKFCIGGCESVRKIR